MLKTIHRYLMVHRIPTMGWPGQSWFGGKSLEIHDLKMNFSAIHLHLFCGGCYGMFIYVPIMFLNCPIKTSTFTGD